MRTLFLSVLFFFFASMMALGQSVQTFVHDFGEHKVYQRFGNIRGTTWVTTIKIKDRQCKQMFVSLVEIENEKIVFKRGDTVWKLQELEDGIKIEFPSGRAVKYKPADGEVPMQYCAESGKEI